MHAFMCLLLCMCVHISNIINVRFIADGVENKFVPCYFMCMCAIDMLQLFERIELDQI